MLKNGNKRVYQGQSGNSPAFDIRQFLSLFDAVMERCPQVEKLKQAIDKRQFPVHLHGLRGGIMPCLTRRLAHQSDSGLFVVVATEEEERKIYDDLRTLECPTIRMPGWGIATLEPLAPNSPIFAQRAQALASIAISQRPIVITTLRTLLSPVPPRAAIDEITITLRIGDDVGGPIELGQKLAQRGYIRTPRISLHDEYAIRGEVLDFFPAGSETAARILFEYDLIEDIRAIDPVSQLSTGSLDQVSIIPRREVIWSERHLDSLARNCRLLDIPNYTALVDHLRDHSNSMDDHFWYPLAFDNLCWFSDWLPEKAMFLFIDNEHISSAAHSIRQEFEMERKNTSGHNNVTKSEGAHKKHDLDTIDWLSISPPPASIRYQYFETLLGGVNRRTHFHTLSGDNESYAIHSKGGRSFFGNIDFFHSEMAELLKKDYQIIIMASSIAQAPRLARLLPEALVIDSAIGNGFALPDQKLCVVTENEIFGRRRAAPVSLEKTRSSPIDSFVELNIGDYVVHINYGIGCYKGIQRMKAGGYERDYIKVEYAGEEHIYLPIEQINLIQRYVGSGSGAPRLDILGGSSWQRRKANAKRHVVDMADRLIRLYSTRKLVNGFSFPEDSEWQNKFEESFPHRETDDQLRAVAEIKMDMAARRPMDRLLCGDVSFGKTEVALRAAFKAIMANKQVAFLAPTTILTEQHYNTIIERMRDFPVVITMLSRFVNRTEQRKAIEGMASGKVNIVVGTHRLLQRDIVFRDLGLIIVDEEQRFGVRHKERLKELKHSVDCLSMTATPIPRTLHMSLLSIRDISLLTTPPHNRKPIHTVVEAFTPERVESAIRAEIDRGGQVFYLHNRIDTLERIVNFLQKLLPDVRFASAHGQMNSSDLEEVMGRFVHGGVEVLVATTIIENGIDIPNVNTIIIERADTYGISQLYQLRGRVGRSDRAAKAYLLYPGRNELSERAMKRLEIISDLTELGSGFKVAMKDLEARGAGNLLGHQQSGDIGAIGFDLYIRMLDEAIRALENDSSMMAADPEIQLELEYNGFIADDYVSDTTEKIDLYRKIATASDENALQSLRDELNDRFGPPPPETENLLQISQVRLLCRQFHIATLVERRGTIEIGFASSANLDTNQLTRMLQLRAARVRPERPNILLLDLDNSSPEHKADTIRNRVSKLFQSINAETSKV